MKTNRSKKKAPLRRRSRQRDAIAAYLQSVESHPTAEEVLRAVRKKVPSIGLATIYRNLEALVMDGLASRTMHAEGARYDSRVDPHHHFICSRCGSVENVEPSAEEEAFIKRYQKMSGASVERVVMEVRGVCAGCR